MYEEKFDERHKTGLVRLTGGNRGLLYCNERQVEVEVPSEEEGGESEPEPVSPAVTRGDSSFVSSAMPSP